MNIKKEVLSKQESLINFNYKLINYKKEKRESLWNQAFHRFKRDKRAVFGSILLFSIVFICILGPIIYGVAPNAYDVNNMDSAPTVEHILGTDNVGRDILARLMVAGRLSIAVGFLSMILSVTIGTIIGAISGYYGGIIDTIIMKITDVLMSLPGLPLLLIIGAVISELKVPNEYRIYIVMGMLSFIGWPGLARLVRGEILSLKERNFMVAADILGLSDKRKIFNHLIPNVIPMLIVTGCSSIGGAILGEASLSFLGLGVTPPNASWGNMINVGQSLSELEQRVWLWASPGLAILLTVVSINLIGEGLRDALDPKMKK